MGLFKQPEYRRFNPKPRYWDIISNQITSIRVVTA